MRRLLLALMICLPFSVWAQINCGSGFTSTGACSVSSGNLIAQSGSNTLPTESGGVITMVTNGCTHCSNNLWENSAQNIQNFTTTFQFSATNSAGLAFGIQNTNNNTNGNGTGMAGGASGELGMTQYCCYGGPNNVFFIKFDLFGSNTTQIYSLNQCPDNTGCNYGVIPLQWYNVNSPLVFSLSPIDLSTNTPDIATITYDGTNLCVTVTDSASNKYGPVCYKVNIPALVGADTAFVGFGASTGIASTNTSFIYNWTFTPNTQTGTAPNFSVASGTYGSTQNVALQSNSLNSLICYNTTGSPATNGTTGCTTGTLYTGTPVAISATNTLYAVTGGRGFTDSSITSGLYTIGFAAASTPTFSPTAGSYSSTQTVTISTSSSGAIICYNTTGSPATNGTTGCSSGSLYSSPVSVSSSETLYAVAGGTGFSDSSVGSAAYTITGSAVTNVVIGGSVTSGGNGKIQ